MDRLEFYRDMYKREVERRNELNNDISIPIGLITFLATAVFFYLTNFEFIKINLLAILFIAPFSIGILFLVFSIYFLMTSYNIFTGTEAYQYTPFPDDIERYYEAYKQFYQQQGLSETDAAAKANNELDDFLQSEYVKNATTNTAINDERSANLFRCKSNMARALIFLLITFLPFTYNYFSKSEHIEKVLILNKDTVTCK